MESPGPAPPRPPHEPSSAAEELRLLHLRLIKLSDAALFLELLEEARGLLRGARAILELGAGLGWGACLVKRLHPDASVVTSDPVHEALTIVPRWERLFEVRLDGVLAAACQALPVRDASFDVVLSFAAAHQFVEQAAALSEIGRVLRPGGRALYLFEPCSPAALRRLARRRKQGPDATAPTDVLVPSRILAAARAAGLRAEHRRCPTLRGRGPLETVYYGALRALPPLQRLLPCTGSFRFHKPA